MTPLLEIGARIAECRKELRFEKKFYCHADGRMVAGVVFFEGDRYLWVVGGRDEHARGTLSDLFQALTEHRNSEDLRQEFGRDWHDRVHDNLLESYRNVSRAGHAEIPPTAYLLSDPYYERDALLRERGVVTWEPLEHHAPCPRCHRSAVLRVFPDGVKQDAPESNA